MVHGQLIQEGRTQKLSYKQLRSLERIDAKKAREQKFLEMGQAAIVAAGYAVGQGLDALGRAAEGFTTGDAPGMVVKIAAGYVFLRWFTNAFPKFSHETHLDELAGTENTPPPPPPTLEGNFCVTFPVSSLNATAQTTCFKTCAERDEFVKTFRDFVGPGPSAGIRIFNTGGAKCS